MSPIKRLFGGPLAYESPSGPTQIHRDCEAVSGEWSLALRPKSELSNRMEAPASSLMRELITSCSFLQISPFRNGKPIAELPAFAALEVRGPPSTLEAGDRRATLNVRIS
jgi:hypothetical protein